MSQQQSGGDDLTHLLAEATGSSVEEIRAGAAEFEMTPPDEADWEYVTEE